MEKQKPLRSLNRKQKDLLFYVLLMAYPVIQFCIFYVVVNFNSILLAFKDYNYGTTGFESAGYQWVGFKQFTKIFTELKANPALSASIGNSLIVYAVTTISMSTLTVWFAFYIFKNKFASKFFRIILFLPQVISPLVMAVMFTSVAENVLPELLGKSGWKIPPLLSDVNTRFGTALFYSIWASFGTSILLYNGNMAAIDPEVIEAATIDGADGFKEFLYIIFPLVYPTFSTFFVVHIAGIFTNQMSLHTLYGEMASPKIQTFGYYLFVRVAQGNLKEYPFLSAMGLMMTFIAVPLTLFVRWGMKKIGPSVD